MTIGSDSRHRAATPRRPGLGNHHTMGKRVMNITQWQQHEKKRQNRISDNRSRRMCSLSVLPKIEKLPRPLRVQLLDIAGDYIGTWPYGVSSAEAKLEAIRGGYKIGSVTFV